MSGALQLHEKVGRMARTSGSAHTVVVSPSGPQAVFVLGLAAFWAWTDMGFTASTFVAGSHDLQLGWVAALGVMVSITIGFVLIGTFSPPGVNWLGGRAVLGVAILGAAATCATLYSTPSGGPASIVAAGTLGLSMAFCAVVWGAASIHYCRQQLAVFVGEAIALATVMYVIPVALGPIARMSAFVLLPVVSCSLLWAMARMQAQEPGQCDPGPERLRLPVGVFVGTGLVSFVAGLFYGLNGYWDSGTSGVLMMVVYGSAALIGVVIASKSDPLDQVMGLWGIGVLVTASAVVPLLFFSRSGDIAATLAWAGFVPIDVVGWVACAEYSRLEGVSVGRAFGWGRALVWGPSCVAALLATYAAGRLVPVTQFALIALAMLLLGALAVSGRRPLIERPAATSDSGVGPAVSDLDWIASRYGLTPREREVLQFLVTGRSVKAMATVMFISENTVKTHVARIYAKTGTHGRQELLDMIERIQ